MVSSGPPINEVAPDYTQCAVHWSEEANSFRQATKRNNQFKAAHNYRDAAADGQEKDEFFQKKKKLLNDSMLNL